MCGRDFSFCIRKILHLYDEYRKIKILSNYEGDAENLEQKPGPENQNRPPGESAPFMEGNPNADASSDSDSSSNSKMNPPGEMPQGDGNNRPDKSDGPPQQ